MDTAFFLGYRKTNQKWLRAIVRYIEQIDYFTRKKQ